MIRERSGAPSKEIEGAHSEQCCESPHFLGDLCPEVSVQFLVALLSEAWRLRRFAMVAMVAMWDGRNDRNYSIR